MDQHQQSRSSTVVSLIAFCGFGLLIALTLPLWPCTLVNWLEPLKGWVSVTLERSSAPSLPSTPTPDTSVVAWSPAEVEAALRECVHSLAPVVADLVPIAALRDGNCGTPAPVLLRGIGSKDRVTIDPPLVVNCQMVLALHRWLDEAVQPAAREAFGSPVGKIIGSSYACRTAYGLPNTRLSQHAFANALDLPVFVLADGRQVDLTQGWGPTQRDLIAAAKTKQTAITLKPNVGQQKDDSSNKVAMTDVVKISASQTVNERAKDKAQIAAPVVEPATSAEAKFLRIVQQKACGIFSTVLGPEANDVHRTHLHLDLQNRNFANVCR